MRVAFLSDIHANLPALRAALAAAEEQGAQRIVIAGDLVGDGPHPAEVLRAVQALGLEDIILGNVDWQVLDMGTRRKKLESKRDGKNWHTANRAWTALRILDGGREWLEGWPDERCLDIGGSSVLVVHGSPRGNSDAIFPSLTPVGLRSKLEPVASRAPDVLVSGHTHVPFARRVDGVLVVNCGSVGKPADGDPRGSFAVVEFGGPEGPRAEIHRFNYPVDEIVADLIAREVPGSDPDQYRLGINP